MTHKSSYSHSRSFPSRPRFPVKPFVGAVHVTYVKYITTCTVVLLILYFFLFFFCALWKRAVREKAPTGRSPRQNHVEGCTSAGGGVDTKHRLEASPSMLPKVVFWPLHFFRQSFHCIYRVHGITCLYNVAEAVFTLQIHRL